MRARNAAALAVLLTLATSACTMAKDEPDVSSAVKSPVAHPAETYLVPGHKALPLAEPEPELPELDFSKLKPAAWELTPTKPMRLANYRVPKADGDPEDGEVSVAIAGGDVESNVNRWIKQFEGTPEVKRSEKAVNPIRVTHVEINGTFAPGGMGGAEKPAGKPDTTMLGAIVELPGTGYFIKFVGPKKTVAAARKDFDKFLTDALFTLMGAPSDN